jgi:DNA-binding transcriptional ArsR family regulator
VKEESLIPEALMVRVAERLKVLGQPVRLRLVEQLKEGSSTPQELSDVLGLSQQNVSKHLLSLHRAGLVSRRPEGANVIYAIEDDIAVAVLHLTLDSVTRQLRELSQLATAASDHASVRDDGRDVA